MQPWFATFVELLTIKWYITVFIIFVAPFIVALVAIPLFYFVSIFLWNVFINIVLTLNDRDIKND